MFTLGLAMASVWREDRPAAEALGALCPPRIAEAVANLPQGASTANGSSSKKQAAKQQAAKQQREEGGIMKGEITKGH